MLTLFVLSLTALTLQSVTFDIFVSMDVCCLLLCFIVLLFSLIAAVYMVNKVEYIKVNVK